jgi:hypothetical protein
MFTNQHTKGYVATEAHPRGGGWRAVSPQPLKRSHLTKTDCVDRMTSNVLLDLPVSRISH